ncbi:hypothetical protein [Actinoplanes sp. G11-F43]|uniref:hypothetical protein n=1 Tax=Actinoplanes sp. G11-F43 TaxID=3424130 RepID=UPI003D346E16
MSERAGHPVRPGSTPILIWTATSVTILIVAAVLWLGWPKSPTVLPDGASRVDVYVIDESPELTTPSVMGADSGWFDRYTFPCGVDAWHVESAGAAICATVGGPYGKVTVIAGDGGKRIDVPADRLTTLRDIAAENGGASRILLARDGEPVGIVTLTDPATAVPAG